MEKINQEELREKINHIIQDKIKTNGSDIKIIWSANVLVAFYNGLDYAYDDFLTNDSSNDSDICKKFNLSDWGNGYRYSILDLYNAIYNFGGEELVLDLVNNTFSFNDETLISSESFKDLFSSKKSAYENNEISEKQFNSFLEQIDYKDFSKSYNEPFVVYNVKEERLRNLNGLDLYNLVNENISDKTYLELNNISNIKSVSDVSLEELMKNKN